MNPRAAPIQGGNEDGGGRRKKGGGTAATGLGWSCDCFRLLVELVGRPTYKIWFPSPFVAWRGPFMTLSSFSDMNRISYSAGTFISYNTTRWNDSVSKKKMQILYFKVFLFWRRLELMKHIGWTLCAVVIPILQVLIACGSPCFFYHSYYQTSGLWRALRAN
jgi:hypothetical protein